jgi:hypothetical protein
MLAHTLALLLLYLAVVTTARTVLPEHHLAPRNSSGPVPGLQASPKASHAGTGRECAQLRRDNKPTADDLTTFIRSVALEACEFLGEGGNFGVDSAIYRHGFAGNLCCSKRSGHLPAGLQQHHAGLRGNRQILRRTDLFKWPDLQSDQLQLSA